MENDIINMHLIVWKWKNTLITSKKGNYIFYEISDKYSQYVWLSSIYSTKDDTAAKNKKKINGIFFISVQQLGLKVTPMLFFAYVFH